MIPVASHQHYPARIAATRLWRWFAVVLGTGLVLLMAPARAAERPPARVARVAVSLDVQTNGGPRSDGERPPPGGGIVRARARYFLARSEAETRELWLLNYAESLRRAPEGLDELQTRAMFDGPFRPGRLDVLAVEVDGKGSGWRRAGPRRDLVVEIPAHTTVVTVEYRVVVPRKYWPFGCSRGRCSLDGAVAPLPSVPARGGIRLAAGGRVIDPVVWSVVRARLDRRETSTWYASRSPLRPPRPLRRRDTLLVVIDAPGSALGLSAYPSVFWGRGWQASRDVVAGTYVTVLDTEPRPPGRWPHESRAQIHRDRIGRVLAIAGESISLSAHRGMTRLPDQAAFVVVGPLRSTVASMHPNAVVVSDQAYELFPSERLLKFHDVVIARACLEQLATAWVVGRHSPSVDGWLGGMIGFALTGEWERGRSLQDEFAQDILAKLTFMPAVDRFLYSGQASFSSAYFRGSEDAGALRDHPLLFSHGLPRGRRIHEKLRDLLPGRALERFYDQLIRDPDQDPQRLAESAYGYGLDWFFDQWLGPYPLVDYTISDVRSQRVGGGYAHVIEVVRDSNVAFIEPVQVLVIERGGEAHHLIWNGDSAGPNDDATADPRRARHRFRLHTKRPLKVVRLDPRFRLHEASRLGLASDQRGDNFDPRFNNRRPAKPRFLYTGLGLNLAASEFARATTSRARLNAVSGFAAFAGGRQRDLRRLATMRLFTDRVTAVGLGAGMNFYFLDKVNRRRRRLRLRLAFVGSSLKGANLDERGGVRLSQQIGLSDDTRRYSFWPEQGHRVSLFGDTHQVVLDGTVMRQHVRLGAGWRQLWRIAHGHVVAHNLGLQFVTPIASELEFRSLLRVGGIGGLSAYLADEAFGRALASGQLEYRHVYTSNLRVNLLHAAWWQHVSGAAFVGASTVSSCASYSGWFDRGSWFSQVGYGVMADLRVLGVTPQLIRLDVAVPLNDRWRPRECLGRRFPGYIAEAQGLPVRDVGSLLTSFAINLTFTQPF
ncbi:MAG: hypothetical protein B7733_17725 [Myxococcales bacterium FL481]|nr:MAG: hypothetical protein B7733_17725 [Myxococcales bacterium FL481]